MHSDIDSEMDRRGIKSLIVFGDSTNGNPDLCYLVGSSLPRGGIYLKRINEDPVLVVSNIDLGNASQGRIKKLKTYTDYGYEKINAMYDREEARTRFYEKLIRDEGLRGPFVIGGKNELANSLLLVDSLRRRGFKIVGEKSPTIVEAARETKDGWEIERLREMGRKTARVVEKTLAFLRKGEARRGKIIHQGKPLTAGRVRRLIGRLLADSGIIAPEDTIFAPGKSSADPHNRGGDDDPVIPGEPIVYDIFPQEPDGYFFDCTRTYSYGRPNAKVKEMYDSVLEAQNLALDLIKEGASCKDVMLSVCNSFESRGYPTVRQLAMRKTVKGAAEARHRGFIHSLGHGVGLTIGERPYLSISSDYPLTKGMAVTVEPGLYDPRWGGVRLEDIVIVGSPSQNLTNLAKDMEL
ncbi:aminopeptidase P family protein [Candidatus Bathyarchaeota archaeon]|nr:MAG: aminopeptidase P family protein [Candidatus Bathyarchaeota archaeon]